MTDTIVRIEHPDTGKRYAVTESAYAESYQSEGYEIISYEDGTPYGGEAQPSARAVSSGQVIGEEQAPDEDGEPSPEPEPVTVPEPQPQPAPQPQPTARR